MALEVRACTDIEEFKQAAIAIGQYFGHEPTAEWLEPLAESLTVERMLAARDDGRIVGGAGSFPFELSIPGGTVRCAGVSVVGVYPTHRRRGVLRSMMRAQIDDVHERGEPIAALWASEETIYGRFGYGMASYAGEIKIVREHAEYAFPLERRGVVRIVDADEALEPLARVWDAALAETPGMFRRDETWWKTRILNDPPERRRGAGPKRIALLELDGEPQAYAMYRHNAAFAEGASTARLAVIEAMGATPQGTAEIWRFLLDIDWQATIEAHLMPVDHPLFFLLAKPRRLRYRVGDGLWVRLVDVGAALSARSYADDGEIVFDVADAFCPWNEGRWKLAGGECTRTEDAADIRCDVTALGSVLLGGFTFAELARPSRRRAARRRNRACRRGFPAHRGRPLVSRDLLSYAPALF